MTASPLVDFSPEFRPPTISSSAAAGAAAAAAEAASSDDLALPLLAILLSGLALVLAWLSAASGGLNIFGQHSRSQQQQQQQQQQLSSLRHQDSRPIAVFVFENFSASSSVSNNVTPSVPSDVGGFDEEESHPVADDIDIDRRRESDADTELDDVNSDADDEEDIDSGNLSDSSDSSRQRSNHGNRSSALAAYDIDVLESDGELDAEMRDRVEEVLLEYTMVMEAKSDADLRNRRLKYFNCLLDADGSQSATGETDLMVPTTDAGNVRSTASVSTASTQTSCSSLSPLTSISSVPTDAVVEEAEEAPNSPLTTLRLRLKYFNDNQRTVLASPVETIVSFKRKHFASELSQSQSVRLIYSGRELKEGEDKGLTLASYALPQDATIHCLVVEAPEQQQPPPQTSLASSQAATAASAMSSTASIEDFAAHLQHGDIGGYMFPLFLAILALIWYCRVYYRAYFNFLSTMAMCAATLLLCAAIVAAFFSAGGGSNAGDPPGGGGGQIRVHRINLDSQATTTGAQQQQRQRRNLQRRDASSMTG